MIQEICKDEKFLAQKAEQATPDDIQTATDLLETLRIAELRTLLRCAAPYRKVVVAASMMIAAGARTE